MKYRIFDTRNGLFSYADIIVEAQSPKKAVEIIYDNVKRMFDGSGDIVVNGTKGSYTYNGEAKNNVSVVHYVEKDKIIQEIIFA